MISIETAGDFVTRAYTINITMINLCDFEAQQTTIWISNLKVLSYRKWEWNKMSIWTLYYFLVYGACVLFCKAVGRIKQIFSV